MPEGQDTAIPAFASCDEHFMTFLKRMIAEDSTATFRARRITTESSTHRCGCEKAAGWFVRKTRDG